MQTCKVLPSVGTQVSDWDDRLRIVNWVDIPLTVQRPTTSDLSGRPKSNEGKEKEKEGKREHKKGTSTGQAAAAAAAAAAAEALEKEKAEEEMKKKELPIETPRPAKKKVRANLNQGFICEQYLSLDKYIVLSVCK